MILCDILKYRNDVIRSVLFLHICANLDMMFARDYASCHAARSTLAMSVANNVHNLRWPAKSLYLNPIDHLLDLLQRKVRAQSLQLNLRKLTRVTHQMGAANPHHYIHRRILSISIQYLAVYVTPGGCKKY